MSCYEVFLAYQDVLEGLTKGIWKLWKMSCQETFVRKDGVSIYSYCLNKIQKCGKCPVMRDLLNLS